MRSAKLAYAEFASLAEVAAPEGLTKLGACLQALDPAAATEAAATLFGTFFELITTFIGERLTVQVLRSAWPTIEDTAPSGDQEMNDRVPIRKLPSGRAGPRRSVGRRDSRSSRST